jgi:hypothetical protein
MKKFILIFYSLILCQNLKAQNPPNEYDDSFNLGIGAGIDYGGLGFKLSALPEKHVVLFAGVGYNFVGAGYNGGISYRFMPSKKTCLYYTLMVGYNAAFRIQGATSYNKIFYGPSTGLGIELHSRKIPANFFNIELLVPIRSNEYHRYLNELKNNPMIDLRSEPWPVTISLGMHIGLSSRKSSIKE